MNIVKFERHGWIDRTGRQRFLLGHAGGDLLRLLPGGIQVIENFRLILVKQAKSSMLRLRNRHLGTLNHAAHDGTEGVGNVAMLGQM